MRYAEQRGRRARQTAQTSVAAAADAHPDQTALPLGHRALPVPQPHPGEAAPLTEEAPHVLALFDQTVKPFQSPESLLTKPSGEKVRDFRLTDRTSVTNLLSPAQFHGHFQLYPSKFKIMNEEIHKIVK